MDKFVEEPGMRYCPACGGRLEEKYLEGEGREIPYCTACGEYRFPIYSTAVSMEIFSPFCLWSRKVTAVCFIADRSPFCFRIRCKRAVRPPGRFVHREVPNRFFFHYNHLMGKCKGKNP